MLLIFIAFYAIDFIPRMAREVVNKNNPVRKVSLWILIILAMSLITMVPSLVFQLMTIKGMDISGLKQFVTYTATIGGIVNLALLWLVLHYKYRG